SAGVTRPAAAEHHRTAVCGQGFMPKLVSGHHAAAGRAPQAPRRAASLRWLPAADVAGRAGLHGVARRHRVE
nr:hypothetical protein [Tanacetum cinerariifolium]